MIIRVEPKDWSMVSVRLMFDDASPDPEDEAVRAYLGERRLEPRRLEAMSSGGRDLQVMTFGGCYLSRPHVQAIVDIQQGFVKREMLSAKIDEALLGLADAGEPKRRQIVSQMADMYAEDDACFAVSEGGQAEVTLDEDEVRRSYARLSAS